MAKVLGVKALSVVAAVSCAVAVSWAQPALAAATLKYHDTQVQVDNNPGSGNAWVWVYAGKEYSATGGSVQYQLTNGNSGSLYANYGKSASTDPGSDVKGFRACTDYFVDGYSFSACSEWAWLS